MTGRGRPSTESPTGAERRRWLSSVLRLTIAPLLDFVYHYLDWNDKAGKPDHGKIWSTIGFLFGLAGIAVFGPATVRTCEAITKVVLLSDDPVMAGVLVKACGVMLASLLALTFLTFAMAFGIVGFKIYANSKAARAQAQTLGQASSFEGAAVAALAAASSEGRERVVE
jgi:hypothetical protein